MSYHLRFSKRAVRDIDQVLIYTLEHFGRRKQEEYRALIRTALADIAANPFAARAKSLPGLHPHVRVLSIARARKPARHFFIYRVVADQSVDIGRLLHDAMDLYRHLPEGFEAQ